MAVALRARVKSIPPTVLCESMAWLGKMVTWKNLGWPTAWCRRRGFLSQQRPRQMIMYRLFLLPTFAESLFGAFGRVRGSELLACLFLWREESISPENWILFVLRLCMVLKKTNRNGSMIDWKRTWECGPPCATGRNRYAPMNFCMCILENKNAWTHCLHWAQPRG